MFPVYKKTRRRKITYWGICKVWSLKRKVFKSGGDPPAAAAAARNGGEPNTHRIGVHRVRQIKSSLHTEQLQLSSARLL